MDIFGLDSFDPNDLIESDYDDEESDKTFTVSSRELRKMDKQDEIDDNEMGETAVEEKVVSEKSAKEKKRKNSTAGGGDGPSKKKDREFEIKKKIAEEVAKYPNLFDICDKSFADKPKTQATWNKVAAAVELPVQTCVNHWNSLKRSAKYHANERKIDCKSGASANEMTVETYREDWPYRDVMGFYTPPSLRDASENIVLNKWFNKPTSTVTSNTEAADTDRSSVGAFLDLDENGDPIYVCTNYSSK